MNAAGMPARASGGRVLASCWRRGAARPALSTGSQASDSCTASCMRRRSTRRVGSAASLRKGCISGHSASVSSAAMGLARRSQTGTLEVTLSLPRVSLTAWRMTQPQQAPMAVPPASGESDPMRDPYGARSSSRAAVYRAKRALPVRENRSGWAPSSFESARAFSSSSSPSRWLGYMRVRMALTAGVSPTCGASAPPLSARHVAMAVSMAWSTVATLSTWACRAASRK